MIQDFFLNNGWHRFDANQNIAWFDWKRSLVVSDTHQGNLILTNDGVLVPIDFRVQPLEGAMLDAVKAMVR
jgi:thiamine kinase-like enzyme